MTERTIASKEDLENWFTLLRSRKLPMTVSAVEGRDRTSAQNRLMWTWAQETGDQVGETADEVQRRWKLDHGIPILCVDREEYRSFCRLTLGRLNRDQRLEAMEFTPVTSEMNVRQMVRFMDTVERECAEGGIVLTQPDQELADYQRRYRDKPNREAA